MPTIDPTQIDQKWEQQDRRIKETILREGMARFPGDLEKAYLYTYEKLYKRQNPPAPETLYHIPKPYTGMI